MPPLFWGVPHWVHGMADHQLGMLLHFSARQV